MEIVLVVATLAVAIAVLYVTATVRTRTRQNMAPLIDDAVRTISGHVDTTVRELRRQLEVIADELQQDREQTKLEGRQIRDRLDYADARVSGLASQFGAELEKIRRLGEQIGAGQAAAPPAVPAPPVIEGPGQL